MMSHRQDFKLSFKRHQVNIIRLKMSFDGYLVKVIIRSKRLTENHSKVIRYVLPWIIVVW